MIFPRWDGEQRKGEIGIQEIGNPAGEGLSKSHDDQLCIMLRE